MLRKSIVCGILLLLIGASSVQCTYINVETISYSIVTNSLNQGLLIYYPTDDVQISQVFPDYNYNHVDNIIVSNIRLRYNFSEGHDLWIVYNEGINTDRDRIGPILPRTNNRTVLLKYTYTYQF